MSKYLIHHHPLDDPDNFLAARYELDRGSLNLIEKGYIAESMAVNITESSSQATCAKVFARLAEAHMYQLNTQFKDTAKRHYDNPAQLIRGESKRNKNRQIRFYGNIADAHARLEQLEKEIVNEATPAELSKDVVKILAFGVVFLALALYNGFTGAAVNFLTGVLISENFVTVYVAGTILVGLFLGFFAVCAVSFGSYILLAWLIGDFPVLSSFIISGVLFLIAVFCLMGVFDGIKAIFQYKPLSEEEHRKNQELIAEKQTLIRELTEYSETMLAKLDIMKKKYMENGTDFLGVMKCHIGGDYGFSEVKDTFSFLRRYYLKVKK